MGWTPTQRGLVPPPRWRRTVRKARIGSSTSIIGSAGVAAACLKCGPTIAADAGDVRNSFAYRSFSMKVISPGPASATGLADWIETFPSPTRRPRTRAASSPTVATTCDSLSSLKGMDGRRDLEGSPRRSNQRIGVPSCRRSGWDGNATPRAPQAESFPDRYIGVSRVDSTMATRGRRPGPDPGALGSVASRDRQLGQAGHKRQVLRPLVVTVEQETAEARVDGPANVVVRVVADAEDAVGGEPEAFAGGAEKGGMRLPEADLR